MKTFIFLSLFLPKLIVGLESPTHALRADADPSAQSASATYITLAQEHPYDRHIEIILHLSGEQFKDRLYFPPLPCCVISSPDIIYVTSINKPLPQNLTAHWSY